MDRQSEVQREFELGIEDIKEKLPHRYPFLMVDRVLESGDQHSKALKNITMNEPQFMGHFPEQSVMPGHLITEGLAQAAAFVGTAPKKAFLVKMNAKFREPVIVGDTILFEVNLVKEMGELTRFTGTAKVEDTVVVDADFATADIDEDEE